MWLRFSASIGMLSTARWSAMKKASNLAALQRLRETLEMAEVEIGVGKGAGIAPGAGVDRGRPHEGAEFHLPWLRHSGFPHPQKKCSLRWGRAATISIEKLGYSWRLGFMRIRVDDVSASDCGDCPLPREGGEGGRRPDGVWRAATKFAEARASPWRPPSAKQSRRWQTLDENLQGDRFGFPHLIRPSATFSAKRRRATSPEFGSVNL